MTKIRIIIVTLVAVFLGIAIWAFSPKSTSSKYFLGMTIAEAKRYMSRDYGVDAFSYGTTDEEELLTVGAYGVSVTDEDISLVFNYHRRLINIIHQSPKKTYQNIFSE